MSGATLHVHEDRTRLVVRWDTDDSVLWLQILWSFKEEFPCHWQRTYRRRERCWSMPLVCRERLARWAAVWFCATEQCWGHVLSSKEEDEE